MLLCQFQAVNKLCANDAWKGFTVSVVIYTAEQSYVLAYGSR